MSQMSLIRIWSSSHYPKRLIKICKYSSLNVKYTSYMRLFEHTKTQYIYLGLYFCNLRLSYSGSYD